MAHNKALLTLILALTLGIGLHAPGIARAGGIGIAPVEIELKEALRGGEYLRTITFMNQEDKAITFEISTEGEVGSWASMRQMDDPAVNVDTVAVPPETDVRLLLKVNVPADAPNGTHEGVIRFQSVPSKATGTEAGMGVSIGIASNLKIDVTGTQRLSGAVLDMGADDVEVDQPPFRVRTTFKNDGNVKATPAINLQVKSASGAVVGEASFKDTVVEADHTERIQSEWDNSGKPAGKYVAAVSVVLGDAEIDQRDLNFEILPRGALTRSGVLDKLALDGQPRAGTMAKITAVFHNTGKIDTRAVLVSEIYRDSALVNVLESRERVVQLGEMAGIDLFFDVPAAGTYTVRAKVGYEGKETETKELAFIVAGEEGLLSTSTLAILGGAVAAIVVLAGTGLVALRRRRAPQA